MFGRKIPDKVMAPTGTPAATDAQRVEKKTMGDHPGSVPRTDAPPRRTSTGGMETIIGEDTVFLGGKIVSKGTLRIDGRVESEVQAEEAVVVGPTGAVKGNIAARNVAISGKVLGHVIARERLEIQPTGEVYGDLTTATGALIIEGGAKVEGKCIMGLVEKKPEPVMQPRPPLERRVPIEANPRPNGPPPPPRPAPGTP